MGHLYLHSIVRFEGDLYFTDGRATTCRIWVRHVDFEGTNAVCLGIGVTNHVLHYASYFSKMPLVVAYFEKFGGVGGGSISAIGRAPSGIILVCVLKH